jgi:hypothetical protein
MTILAFIGLVCLVCLAAFLTIVAAATWIGESTFSDRGTFGPVLAAVAAGLWAIVWWVNPVSISVSIS